VPPRHRKPTFADSLTPKAERKPRITPESDRDRRLVWLVGKIDFDGPWCWKMMDLSTLHRVHERLSAFERMTIVRRYGAWGLRRDLAAARTPQARRVASRIREDGARMDGS